MVKKLIFKSFILSRMPRQLRHIYLIFETLLDNCEMRPFIELDLLIFASELFDGVVEDEIEFALWFTLPFKSEMLRFEFDTERFNQSIDKIEIHLLNCWRDLNLKKLNFFRNFCYFLGSLQQAPHYSSLFFAGFRLFLIRLVSLSTWIIKMRRTKSFFSFVCFFLLRGELIISWFWSETKY